MPKRDNADAASAPKRQKTMPAMQASKHASDTPGWCSDPSLKMSAQVIAALDEQRWISYLKMSDLREYAVDDDGWIDPNSLKGGSGDRTLYQVAEYDDDGDDEDEDRANKIWMIEDAEVYMAKYGYANHGKNLEAMHTAIGTFNECRGCPGFDIGSFMDAGYNMTTVLLLGHNQPICRSNAIPALTKAGIVIQRREAPGAGEE